jgi:predicted ATPase
MVAHLLGAEDIHRDLEELILEKTEGVAFFIEEFIKSLRELKVIEKRGKRYHLGRDMKDVIVPSTVQDVVMARIDLLPEGAKSLLQKGSVAGREFRRDLIATVTGLSEQELLSQLSVLKDSELLYERGIYPQSTYIFKHALTQEVAYNSLLSKRRKEIHEAIARAMEQLYHQRLEEFCEVLANHYSKSDESKKAYHYFKLSGHKAMKNYSNWEAFYFYKEANQVLKKEPESGENLKRRLEILQLLLGPMRLLGYPEDSPQLLGEGEDLANKVGEQRSLTHFYSTIGHYNLVKGDSQRGLEYSEKSYQEALKTQDIELMINPTTPLISQPPLSLCGERRMLDDS